MTKTHTDQLPTLTMPEKLRVLVDIDRNTAIRAGRAEYGKVVVQIDESMLADLTDEQRDELLALPVVRDSQNPNVCGAFDLTDGVTVADANVASITAALDEHRARRETREADEAARKREAWESDAALVRAWMDTPDEDLLITSVLDGMTEVRELRLWHHLSRDFDAVVPEFASRRERLHQIASERSRQVREQRAAELARKTELCAEASRRRWAQLDAWVAAHGDWSMRARAALGLTVRGFAAAIGYRDARTVRRMLRGQRSIPVAVSDRVQALLREARRF